MLSCHFLYIDAPPVFALLFSFTLRCLFLEQELRETRVNGTPAPEIYTTKYIYAYVATTFPAPRQEPTRIKRMFLCVT